MAFCAKCGAQVGDDTKFCPVCGAAIAAAAAVQQPEPQYQPPQQDYQQQPQYQPPQQDYQQQPQYQQPQQQYQQPQYQPQQQYQQPQQQYQPPQYQQPYQQQAVKTGQPNKIMAILSYFSLLVLIPIFAVKDDPFVRFHANQGLLILIPEIVATILGRIASALVYDVYVLSLILSIIVWVIQIACFVFAVLGLISAIKEETKPLPLIGGIKILK